MSLGDAWRVLLYDDHTSMCDATYALLYDV